MLFAAYKVNAYYRDFYASALHTTGRVTKVVSKSESEEKVYGARVVFSDATGRSVTFDGGFARSPQYEVGDVVNVAYRESSPEDAMIETTWNRWAKVLVLTLLAVIFLGKGIRDFLGQGVL